MRKLWRKTLLTALGVLFLVAVALFATACGETEKHTLRFLDGTTEIAAVEAGVGANLADKLPEDPQNKGVLTFAGWAKTEGGELVELPEKMPKEDATYYAQWNAPLTLVAGEGGTLAQSSYAVRVGKNIKAFLEGKDPAPKSGLTFAGWYDGAYTLSDTRNMPASAVTLTAKYNASYTVNIYRQNLDGNYPATPSDTVTGQAIYGEPFSYEEAEPHFFVDYDHETFFTDSLGANDVFELYLERIPYGVHYSVNLPASAAGGVTILTDSVLYGNDIVLADGEGFGLNATYRFAGWATSENGEVEYEAGDTVKALDATLFLYAKWDVAYTDRFGGSDLIFLPQREAGVAVLVREGIGEKRGTYDGELFTFAEAGLTGKVNADGTFAYHREATDNTYVKWNSYTQAVEDAFTLDLDGYMYATYTCPDGKGGTETAKGTYSRNAATGLYSFVIREGEKEGSGFYFYLGTYGETLIFAPLGEEASYGIIGYYSLYDFDGYYVPNGAYYAMFDGMGVVTISDYGTFYYRQGELEGEFIAYLDGRDIMRMLVVAFDNGVYGWLRYNETVAGTYRNAEGEGTLVLDGYGMSAVYNGGAATEWLYYGASELEEGILVQTPTDSFLLDTGRHTYRRIAAAFEERYWLDTTGGESHVSSDRFLVLYDDMTASVFVGGKLAARGTFTVAEYGAYDYLYTYQQTELVMAGAVLPVSMTFRIDTYIDYNLFESFSVYYIMEETAADGTVTKRYTSYLDADGNEIRAYSSDLADYLGKSGAIYPSYTFYFGKETAYFGVDYMVFRYADYASGYYRTMYYRIEEDGSITKMFRPPVSFGLTNAKREIRNGNILWIDGYSRAIYFPLNEKGIPGSFALKDSVKEIFTFTPDDPAGTAFDFIVIYVDGYEFEMFMIYDADYAGDWTSENDGTYTFDGFGYSATYTDIYGVAHAGQYYFLDDNIVRFIDLSTYETREIEIREDRTFLKLDGYFGAFYAYEDFQVGEDVLRFDGKGGAEFGHYEYNYFGDVTGFTVVVEGSYTILDDEEGRLSVTLDYGTEPVTFEVLLIFIDAGYYDYYCYIRAFAEKAAYYSEEWEYLVLDGFGFATYIDTLGFVHRDLQYEESGENEVIFYMDGYAHVVELNGSSFRITDTYFNPLLVAEYGNANYLMSGSGYVYVRVWQMDEDGTMVAEFTGFITQTGVLMTDYAGKTFTPPETETFGIKVDGDNTVLWLEFEYDGYFAHVEFTLGDFLGMGVYYVVGNATYYWMNTVDWNYQKYTVRAYRYVRGNANASTGAVMKFELLYDGEPMNVYGYDKTAAGVNFAKVYDGENAGYYFVIFSPSGNGVQSIIKYEVQTLVGSEETAEGVTLTVTAYYALDGSGELFDVHLRYTQSDFGGQVYDLETREINQIGKESWHIYATYTYTGTTYSSYFDYVLTLGSEPSIRECMYGYVYSTDDAYIFAVLIDYDFNVYRIDAFYVGKTEVEVKSFERNEDGTYRVSTNTTTYNVRFYDKNGEAVCDVELAIAEQRKDVQAILDGESYTVIYSLFLGTESLYRVESLAVGGDVLAYSSIFEIEHGKFGYVVTEGARAGYYVVTFTLDGGDVVQSASLEKYEMRTIEYRYSYFTNGYESYTIFTAYYALDESGNLIDVFRMTYRIGTSTTVIDFDPYNDKIGLGENRYWLQYSVDTTHYHFVLDLSDESAMLCYYAYTYGDDSGYTFVLLYDMEGKEIIYTITMVVVDSKVQNVVSATLGADGVWTVVTENATYTVRFIYNAEQETFSAEVLSVA